MEVLQLGPFLCHSQGTGTRPVVYWLLLLAKYSGYSQTNAHSSPTGVVDKVCGLGTVQIDQELVENWLQTAFREAHRGMTENLAKGTTVALVPEPTYPLWRVSNTARWLKRGPFELLFELFA